VRVEGSGALASDKLTGDRIVLGGDQGGERLEVDLLVEVGEFAAQEVDDAVGSDRVDAGEQDEGAIAIRPAQPGEVAHVGRSRLGKIRGRRIPLAGAAILLVEHWNGERWDVIASPNVPPSDNRLNAAAALAAGQLAVGSYFSELGPVQTLIEQRCS
jgi:hypothetical protein